MPVQSTSQDMLDKLVAACSAATYGDFKGAFTRAPHLHQVRPQQPVIGLIMVASLGST